jgi:hypothetical protein
VFTTPSKRRSSGITRPSRAAISLGLVAAMLCACMGAPASAADEQVYNGRPKDNQRRPFGHVGPTGIHAYIHPNVTVTIETIAKGSPAEGKFKAGDVIRAINGKPFAGHNPFVIAGNAITHAEATDGKLVFTVEADGKQRDVTVTIPVLGKYAETWPVDCAKSEKIVAQAAAFYAAKMRKAQQDKQRGIPGAADETQGIPGALIGLFLLSTGDDAHLPIVKEYFRPFIDNPKGIGDHTWNNGYNGILVTEYYLRTGDKDVMPVIQFYCDNAKERQKFGIGWPHWGKGINPRYVGGGLMNPASAQILTTLLLAKECGADVDERTLLGCLKFFYRFPGRGTVPYGDHRGEGGLGSNGKDGMIAAAMHVASNAQGDTSIYKAARDRLSMSTLMSYPALAVGHGDNGRGDGIWRGVSASYMATKEPTEYRSMMDRLSWFYDLSRFHDGSMGLATINGFNKVGTGAGVLLAYTAHRKTLRITGAPKSKHAVDFALPEHLWGRPADLVFKSTEHLPEFATFGKAMPIHRIQNMLGNAYKNVDAKQTGITHEQLLQQVYHHQYMVRAQAAKALRKAGHLDDLEKMLTHKDPRVRRAALDGIVDWRYWFNMGKDPLKTEQYTPGMIEAITKMISDPDESLYVIDGALFAMHHMPAWAIEEHVEAILPWTTHDDWWLRQASFVALQGLSKDEKRYLGVLPTLTRMMVNEYHTQPRQTMSWHLDRTLRKVGLDSPAGAVIIASTIASTAQSEIKPGLRSREGGFNLKQGIDMALRHDASSALAHAKLLRARFDRLDTGRLLQLIAATGTGREGFFPIRELLDDEQKQAMSDLLHNAYLPEMQKRLKAEAGVDLGLIDTVLALKQLKGDVTGWQAIGAPAPAKRVWRFVSFDPTSEDDMMPRRDRKRFREVKLPDGFEGWHKPGFDDSKWNKGAAPIGIGEFKKRDLQATARSAWGDGEFLLARTTFELDATDYDLYRLRILNNQGFHIYLNGKRINTYIWWSDNPNYWKREMSDQQAKLLKKGKNTLAVYANAEFPSAMKPHRWTQEKLGFIDVYIEGLRISDLQ